MITKRLSCVVSVLLLSSTFFVALATVPVSANATTNLVDENALEATEDGVYFTVSQTSIASQIPGIDSSLKENQRLIKGDLKMEAVAVDGLKSARFPDLSGKAGGDNPSPRGEIDPEPMDAPFLPNDVLVYNNTTNSEKNVSLAKTSDGTLYAAYDHDIGTGLRDVYVSKSTDGGSTWTKRDIAVDAAEDESCPSIAGDYSPNFVADVLYVWYSNPTLEFAWSLDGDTWSYEDFGGGPTWWENVRCPYVDVRGDFVVIVSEDINPNDGRDNWRILYTLDGMAWTSYYWDMWPGAWVYQPQVSIVDDDEIAVVMDVYDKSDPNPANWVHDGVIAHATLTNDLMNDNWDLFYSMTGIENLALTSPTVEAFGERVTIAQEVYNPGILPLSTSMIFCMWTPDFSDIGGASWNYCEDDVAYIAYDPTETKDQKYPSFQQENGELHFAWLNGTDINYRFSPDGGFEWLTGPMKVNDPGSSTAMDAWHSPDVISDKGRPYIAWHDTRGSDDIYFQTFETFRWYGIRTDQSHPELQIREVGDSWHNSSYYYLWSDGSSHDVEAQSSYVDPANTRFSFSQWDDGQLVNPATVTVSDSSFDIAAQYDMEFWLDMIATGGTTNPSTGWQLAYTWITIEAFPPAAPPGGQYIFMGWSGNVTGTDNPCVDCVYMDGPKTISVSWMLQWSVTIDTIPSGLTIQVDGIDYVAQYTTWFNDSQMYNINAPSPQSPGPTTRYMWTHWSDAGPQSHNVFVTGPETFIANYKMQRAVTITTAPTGFDVIVDGTTYLAPASFWWNDTSEHVLEAIPSFAVGPSSRFSFTGWSDFGARIHSYWANTSGDTVTAFYTFNHKITILANHPGLTIDLDGLPIDLPYVYWCEDGTTHVIGAPTIQQFGDTRYVFNSWSDGGAQLHVINCASPAVVQADYDKEYRVYVNSTLDGNPSTLDVIVGGTTYPTPAEVWWPADTMMTLDTNEFQPNQNPLSGTRYRFVDWDTCAIKSRAETVNMPGKMYVANFVTQHKLTIIDPWGTPTTLPIGWPVGNGIYFDADTVVEITTNDAIVLTPDHRYLFNAWSSIDPGGYSGPNNPATVTMVGPIVQSTTWSDQYLLTIVTALGSPGAGGYQEQQSPSEFWYDAGGIAYFWVESEIFFTPALDEKAVFDSWAGGINGTAMNVALVVTASWHLEFLVTVDSAGYGTEPPPTWVIESGTYALTIESSVGSGGTRADFAGWTSSDIANGSYDGPNRQMTLTVTGPILETAAWEVQHLLTIISAYGTISTSGYVEEQSPTEFWYEENTVANFWTEDVIITSTGDEKVVFDGWTGGTNGTTIVAPLTVTVNWHTEYLVTVDNGGHGTEPAPEWVIDGETYDLAIENLLEETDTRYRFSGWTSLNGYEGPDNETTLTVTSPIAETATWTTEYLLTIVSVHGPDSIGTPIGAGWYEDGSTATLSIEQSVTILDTIFTFENWVGTVADPNSASTTLVMNEPKLINVEWSSQPVPDEPDSQPLDLMLIIPIVLIVVVVAVVAILLMKRGKPVEDEVLEMGDEEDSVEEPSGEEYI